MKTFLLFPVIYFAAHCDCSSIRIPPDHNPSQLELKSEYSPNTAYESSVVHTATQRQVNQTTTLRKSRTTSFLGSVANLYINTPDDEITETEERMAEFASVLQSYVSDSTFEIVEFERSAENLKAELLEISLVVVYLSPSIELSNQLRSITRMFNVYAETTSSLRYVSTFRDSGTRLLYKITELNVRTMALHDSYGMLASNSVHKVNSLKSDLFHWSKRFRDLENVSPEVKSEFRVQYNLVDNKLQYLSSFVEIEVDK